MESMISNYNEITLWDIISYNFIGSNVVFGLAIFIIILVTLGMMFDVDILDNIKNKFIKFIVIISTATLVCVGASICILSMVFTEKVRYKRLDEIITYANENGLSNDLNITEDLIIYKDKACKHNIRNIESYCFKSDNVWVIVED